MIKVGITGGIGSGKSTICRLFEMLGVPVYYADDEARKLYDENAGLKAAIIKHFGKSLYPNGLFDKAVMKELVFKNDQKLALLNSLVHPVVRAQSAQWFRDQKSPYAIKEAALLIESAAYTDLDEIILVDCPVPLRIQRVQHRDQLTIQEIQLRIDAQMPDEKKKQFAQHSIMNDDQHLIIPQVIKLHEDLLRRSQ